MPAFVRAILIQESAEGGLSYKGTKNVPWHILAPAAVACDIIIVRRSAHPAGGFFHIIGNAISYYMKKDPHKWESFRRFVRLISIII